MITSLVLLATLADPGQDAIGHLGTLLAQFYQIAPPSPLLLNIPGFCAVSNGKWALTCQGRAFACQSKQTDHEKLFLLPCKATAPLASLCDLCVTRSRMDRYRYFIFNQRNMVVLGMFQIALSTVCVVSGFIDSIFRTESQLGRTRAPIWAGMVNVLIVASIISCVAILIVIGYSSFTLNYGEEEELSSAPVHVIHTRFILSKVVKGASIAMLAASVCSAFFVLAMAYLGCRSLPRCSCYDSVTGMEWLQPTEDQNQAVEMVCAVQSPGDRIFNFPDRFPAQDVDAEEDTSKPPPYIRLT
ncbi:hypothetical protein BTVI_73394 [Pitangus sulphuratus]|nr:hypothetical protein BTVI_73394 [Pitangus sulphuratus]